MRQLTTSTLKIQRACAGVRRAEQELGALIRAAERRESTHESTVEGWFDRVNEQLRYDLENSIDVTVDAAVAAAFCAAERVVRSAQYHDPGSTEWAERLFLARAELIHVRQQLEQLVSRHLE